jgi:hypothetical protein
MTTFRHKIKPLSFGAQNGYIDFRIISLIFIIPQLAAVREIYALKIFPGGGKNENRKEAARRRLSQGGPGLHEGGHYEE